MDSKDIREYAEDMAVEIDDHKGRPVVRAFNEAGHNCTEVDVLDLIRWVKVNHPEWINQQEI